jgi:hypothetical protein
MTPADWGALAVSILTIVIAFTGAIRWLVKHYLNELKPNSGSSLKDSVSRLETRVDEIFKILSERK